MGYPDEKDTVETLKKLSMPKKRSKPKFRKNKNRILEEWHIVRMVSRTTDVAQICTSKPS